MNPNKLEVIDVTLALMFYLGESGLHLFAWNKWELVGFYDVCPEKEKKLLIVWEEKGQGAKRVWSEHEVVDL